MKMFILVLSFSVFLVGCQENELFSVADKTAKQLDNLSENVTESDDTLVTRIQRVYDGDTVYISCSDVEKFAKQSKKDFSDAKCNRDNHHALRILNIDSPELKSKDLYGKEAVEYAKKVLDGKEVTITFSKKKNPTDHYGRLLVYITVDDTLYQEMIVREGLARVAYLYEPDTQYAEHLLNIQEEAKREKRNIWSVEGYVKEDGFDMSVVH